MNIYQFVKDTCSEQNPSINTAEVQTLVGTLRSAGFQDELRPIELVLVRQLVLSRLAKPQVRTAAVQTADADIRKAPTVMVPMTSQARFDEIDALRGKNLCPRCKKGTEVVKLSNYQPSRYCKKCRVALWD